MTSDETTPLPERFEKSLFSVNQQDTSKVDELIHSLRTVLPVVANYDGQTETLDSVEFTHRFVRTPGDYDHVSWHYVTCGQGESIVFLHGFPESWYQWHHQMAALSTQYHCIGVDLKGFGQSEKGPGDYRYEGVADQLFEMLKAIGVHRFFLCTHDRGTVPGDFLVANHADAVLGYIRGEQHLYHYNALLSRHMHLVLEAPYNHILDDPARVLCMAYAGLTTKSVPTKELVRAVQEFSHEGIVKAVPRYYASMTVRQEWLARRNRLMAAWRCPVMLLQGYDSVTQPREFYEGIEQYLESASTVLVRSVQAGHFFPMESPIETTDMIRELLELAASSRQTA